MNLVKSQKLTKIKKNHKIEKKNPRLKHLSSIMNAIETIFLLKICLTTSLTLIQPGKGRFALTYMSPDYLHGSHAGPPGWIRVKHSGLFNRYQIMRQVPINSFKV